MNKSLYYANLLTEAKKYNLSFYNKVLDEALSEDYEVLMNKQGNVLVRKNDNKKESK